MFWKNSILFVLFLQQSLFCKGWEFCPLLVSLVKGDCSLHIMEPLSTPGQIVFHWIGTWLMYKDSPVVDMWNRIRLIFVATHQCLPLVGGDLCIWLESTACHRAEQYSSLYIHCFLQRCFRRNKETVFWKVFQEKWVSLVSLPLLSECWVVL